MVYELLGGFDTVGGVAEWMDADQMAALAGEPLAKIEAILGGLVGVGFVEVRTVKELEFERSEEGRRVAELKAAGLWAERGMCPRCGTWLYRYGDAPLGTHFGRPLVNLRTREEDARLVADQRRERSETPL